MKPTPYFDNLAQVIALFDNELMVELLERVARELAARGNIDARNYVLRAQSALVPLAPSSILSS